jgi:DNA-binding NarL/FixJ family response regulator
MQLKTYIEKPITKAWFDQVLMEIKNYANAIHYLDFKSLLNSLTNTKEFEKNRIVVIDVDSSYYLELINQITEECNDVKFIGLGIPRELGKTIEILKNGFCAYLELGNNSIDFVNAIRSVKHGTVYLPSYKVEEFIKYLITTELDFNNNKSTKISQVLSAQLSSLTEKQQEVCDYLIKGYTYKEISQFLGVTTHTINQRAKSIYKKMEVNSRGELSYLFLK